MRSSGALEFLCDGDTASSISALFGRIFSSLSCCRNESAGRWEWDEGQVTGIPCNAFLNAFPGIREDR